MVDHPHDLMSHLDDIDHGRNRGQRSAQFVGEHRHEPILLLARHLERGDAIAGNAELIARADVADVALDHFARADVVDIADEFDPDRFAAFRAERQIFVANVLVSLEHLESFVTRGDILELADFPKMQTDQSLKWIIQQIEQEWIRIDDLSTLRIRDQDSVLSRLEEATVTKLRLRQLELERASPVTRRHPFFLRRGFFGH